MTTRTFITRLLVGIIIAVVVAALGLLGYQLTRSSLSQRICAKIDRLALHPPDGTAELEWAVYVYWTHNLHCNTIPQVYGSVSSLRELDRLLDDSIRRGPDLQTIDVLWGRYAGMSRSGSEYRKKYEPVRDAAVNAIARQGKGYSDARSYQDFLEYVKSTNPAVD